jgi:large subunit ribosomal protein L15
MRLPKLRGFKNRLRVEYVALNVGQLKTYAVDGRVSPETLEAKGLIDPSAKVKLLGGGVVSAKLEVHAHRVSASAKQKIESAGGTVVLIDAGTR